MATMQFNTPDWLAVLQEVLSGVLTKAQLSATLPCVAPPTDEHVKVDPFDESQTWVGEWRNSGGHLLGHVQIHEGGRCFAEFDVCEPHPTKAGWFVEAVSAWGARDAIKTELRLLEMPSE